MNREFSMIVLSVVVAGLMALILFRFLRRLRKVEEEMWGEKARQVDESRKVRLAARKAAAGAAREEADAANAT
jgi:hypothetical protein